MSRRLTTVSAFVAAGLFSLSVLTSGCAGSSVKRETAQDAQLDVMVASARTKADHQKIAALYSAEADAEANKAKALRDQAEAYKTHQHDFYERTILDLIEHTDALAKNYQEASDRHRSLAKIHQQIAAEIK